MAICDKVQSVGIALQDNLNDRGVSCTFGSGSGEKNILQLVELVNDTNFKGSSDVVLKIGANRPYLLTGETTDVVVKLENGLCEPLKNKSVTVSDGTNTVNGVTDEKGEFALYNVSVTDDTTFTATYYARVNPSNGNVQMRCSSGTIDKSNDFHLDMMWAIK